MDHDISTHAAGRMGSSIVDHSSRRMDCMLARHIVGNLLRSMVQRHKERMAQQRVAVRKMYTQVPKKAAQNECLALHRHGQMDIRGS